MIKRFCIMKQYNNQYFRGYSIDPLRLPLSCSKCLASIAIFSLSYFDSNFLMLLELLISEQQEYLQIRIYQKFYLFCFITQVVTFA